MTGEINFPMAEQDHLNDLQKLGETPLLHGRAWTNEISDARKQQAIGILREIENNIFGLRKALGDTIIIEIASTPEKRKVD